MGALFVKEAKAEQDLNGMLRIGVDIWEEGVGTAVEASSPEATKRLVQDRLLGQHFFS